MKKYKIGIIGYGGFGKFLHHWWDKMDNAEVAAIAYGEHPPEIEIGCRAYSDWKELIDDPEIDIVSIVTPPNLHVEMACAAMAAGKHVLLEKPAALDAEGAQRLVDVQQQTGRAITVNHMIRYNPIIQILMHLDSDGALGKLRHATVSNYAQDESLPADHWFWNEASSGGIQVEHGVHFFDIINALGKERYKEVWGTSHARNDSQRDRVAAMVRYDGGLIASYYHAFAGPGFFEQTTISLAYDLARVEINGWMPLKGTLKALVSAHTKPMLESLPGWTVTKSEPTAAADDASRLEGWSSPENESGGLRSTVNFGGTLYDADQTLWGTFEIPQSKDEVYGRCVQLILSDLIKKTQDGTHQMTVTLEDGIEALRIALLASK